MQKGRINVLILCPLSVVETWSSETKLIADFNENVTILRGSKEERNSMYNSLKIRPSAAYIVVSNYETVLNDIELGDFSWDIIVIDEAHRVKNASSILYEILVKDLTFAHIVLMTGTPIQNNLRELYSLLALVDNKNFPLSNLETFVRKHSNDVSGKSNEAITKILKNYVLRRTKEDVAINLPPKSELVIFHGLTALQKKLYKTVLLKDSELLNALASQGVAKKSSLNNILCQLRKCCLHPYLFQGVEPEPFQPGDHLIHASQKLTLLDQLLDFLKEKKHKVLVFSQFTSMLDIMQDYLDYRSFSYERLDGSCRSEERFLSIKNFNSLESTFVFLLSTKAGGQGITLTSADTVVFMDCDFNPQNDIQAAARSHRIGQTKPVKIIRLVCKDSVEELIVDRAKKKLELSTSILDTGDLRGLDENEADDSGKNTNSEKMGEAVKFGLEKILNDIDNSDDLNVVLEDVLGSTDENGSWVSNPGINAALSTEESNETSGRQDMYDFEGENYKHRMKLSDETMQKLVEEVQEQKAASQSITASGARVKTSKRIMSPEELDEILAKKAKIDAENAVKRQESRRLRLEKMWKENDYQSIKLVKEDLEGVPFSSRGELSSDIDENDALTLTYVSGDVTKPIADDNLETAIIIHCVDNSGQWGEGGVFTALNKLSPDVASRYELAFNMKDLAFGDVHLVPIKQPTQSDEEPRTYVALIVAQKRSTKGVIGDIDVKVLDSAFAVIAQFCKTKGTKRTFAVHSPRLGHSMKTFNWYGAERLLKKHFISNNVKTLVYYFSRRQTNRTTENSAETSASSSFASNTCISNGEEPSTNPAESKTVNTTNENHNSNLTLLSFLSGCHFVLSSHLSKDVLSKLERYIIAYDGNIDEYPETETSKTKFYIFAENEDTSAISGYKLVSVAQFFKCVANKSAPK